MIKGMNSNHCFGLSKDQRKIAVKFEKRFNFAILEHNFEEQSFLHVSL